MILNLKTKPKYFRSPQVRRRLAEIDGLPRIDRDGGFRQAGIIRGVSVITKGEALGHEMWIDEEFLYSVDDAINAEQHGAKSRFTHPSVSGDGLGKTVGRVMDAWVEGDQVYGDLHFIPSAHNTPDGDLANYLMDLSDDEGETPGLYGASIAFGVEQNEMNDFMATHSDNVGNFRSPDKGNKNNYPHARLAGLHAVDLVDDPAANPQGLFSREGDIGREIDALMQFALGLSEVAPKLSHFEVEPERVRAFIPRFLAAHNLEIKPMPKQSVKLSESESDQVSGTSVVSVDTVTANSSADTASSSPDVDAEDTNASDGNAESGNLESGQTEDSNTGTEVAAESASQPEALSDRSEAAKYLKSFGESGAVWFAEGLTFEQAHEKHVAQLQQQIESLNQKLSARPLEGETDPVSFSTNETKSKGFATNYRFAQSSRK